MYCFDMKIRILSGATRTAPCADPLTLQLKSWPHDLLRSISTILPQEQAERAVTIAGSDGALPEATFRRPSRAKLPATGATCRRAAAAAALRRRPLKSCVASLLSRELGPRRLCSCPVELNSSLFAERLTGSDPSHRAELVNAVPGGPGGPGTHSATRRRASVNAALWRSGTHPESLVALP